MTNEQWKALKAELSEPVFKPKAKLSAAQKKALAAYNFRLREEDRYFGSVFVNAHGQKLIEAKTKAAYDACKALGMGPEHGL
jgi:hypothetical protein